MIEVKYYAMFNMPGESHTLITLCDNPGEPMMFYSRAALRSYVVLNYKGVYNIIIHRVEVKT